MFYKSTRDHTVKKTFSECLLSGLSVDGGLYVPDMIPQWTEDEIQALKGLSYAELAFKIIQVFVGNSIPDHDLEKLIQDTYSPQVFGSEKIAPISKIKETLHIMDLSMGPSLAFKDMAMQLLGRLIEYELNKQSRSLTILGASSGDTVSSAEEALRSKPHVNVVMLTPKEGMSPFQKAQAGSILDENIFNLAIDGRFDDCQDLVKAVNRDLEFKQDCHIGAVNSINWARIMAQIVYHVAASLAFDVPIDIVVPSGNFGNVYAGYIAKEMGFPIRRLIVATNENDVLDVFIKTGIYQQQDVVVTSSPSMDISKASNLERFLFDILGRGDTQLKAVMDEFESTRKVDISAFLDQIQATFSSGVATHQDRISAIKAVHEMSSMVIDPHTAAGIKVGLDYIDDNVPMVCMATAKPSKFEETVHEALGVVPERPAAFIGLEEKPQRYYDVDATTEAIKQFIKEKVL